MQDSFPFLTDKKRSVHTHSSQRSLTWTFCILAPNLSWLQSEFLPTPASFALVDFRLDVIEIDGKLWLDYDYRTELFEESTIERWHDDFQSLLKEMITNLRQHLADVLS